jgi:hypothetical protein
MMGRIRKMRDFEHTLGFSGTTTFSNLVLFFFGSLPRTPSRIPTRGNHHFQAHYSNGLLAIKRYWTFLFIISIPYRHWTYPAMSESLGFLLSSMHALAEFSGFHIWISTRQKASGICTWRIFVYTYQRLIWHIWTRRREFMCSTWRGERRRCGIWIGPLFAQHGFFLQVYECTGLIAVSG